MTSEAGRRTKSSDARIVGVVSCVPQRLVDNSDFLAKFGDKANEIAKMTGVLERRWVAPGQTTADLCEAAARSLMEELGWTAESVDAVIFVSQTPDYRLPATACALHGRLGLSPGAIAYDVNLGCSGYPYGLWMAMSAIQTGAADRVLLLVGDTISKTVDPEDRSTAMLFGDAGTATAIERGAGGASFVLGSDGRGERNLIIPQGAYRSADSGFETLGDRRLDALYMDGGEIFNFTLKAVPALVQTTIEHGGVPVEDYDAFCFHQANAFMVKHLIKKAKLPVEKVPINIDRYGNTSSASIPLLMTTDLAERLKSGSTRLAMFGFGVGYSWASAALELEPLRVARTMVA